MWHPFGVISVRLYIAFIAFLLKPFTATQIMLAAGIGMPASILCISRRLFKITSIQTVSVTRADVCCLFIPFHYPSDVRPEAQSYHNRHVHSRWHPAFGTYTPYVAVPSTYRPMLTLFVDIPVHAHRFDILEDIGCYPVTYGTLASYFLYYVWPIALGAVSFVYSGLTLRSFFIRRAQFSSLLSSNSLNMNRYIRLMMLSISDMSFTVPFSIYIMYIGTHGIELAPWISWAETHYHWNRVEVVPASLWRGIPGVPDHGRADSMARRLLRLCLLRPVRFRERGQEELQEDVLGHVISSWVQTSVCRRSN